MSKKIKIMLTIAVIVLVVFIAVFFVAKRMSNKKQSAAEQQTTEIQKDKGLSQPITDNEETQKAGTEYASEELQKQAEVLNKPIIDTEANIKTPVTQQPSQQQQQQVKVLAKPISD